MRRGKQRVAKKRKGYEEVEYIEREGIGYSAQVSNKPQISKCLQTEGECWLCSKDTDFHLEANTYLNYTGTMC